MRFFRTFLVVVVVVAGIAWLSYTFWYAYQPKPIRLQGQVVAQQYNVSSKVAGRVDQVFVRKGDLIQKGQLVFTLLSPEITAKLAQAVAGRDAADALAKEANTGARKQQIEAAQDQWKQAQAAADLLEKTYQRINSLYTDGVVSQQKRDEAYTQFQTARFAANGAYQMFKMTEEGARNETIAAAEGKARMAAGAVAEVKVYAAETQVESWHDGEVSQILLQTGEIAPQGFPVVTIIDMNDAWVVFHVREDRLADFQKETEFSAAIPALGKSSYRFRVNHVAVMGDFAIWRATNSGKGFDMRSFEVEARPIDQIKGLRAGMSVLVEK